MHLRTPISRVRRSGGKYREAKQAEGRNDDRDGTGCGEQAPLALDVRVLGIQYLIHEMRSDHGTITRSAFPRGLDRTHRLGIRCPSSFSTSAKLLRGSM